MIHVTVLAPLVAELQKELGEVSFISVIVEASNGKPAHNNGGSILFSLNSRNQSKVFRSSFCHREKYEVITN